MIELNHLDSGNRLQATDEDLESKLKDLFLNRPRQLPGEEVGEGSDFDDDEANSNYEDEDFENEPIQNEDEAPEQIHSGMQSAMRIEDA